MRIFRFSGVIIEELESGTKITYLSGDTHVNNSTTFVSYMEADRDYEELV